VPRFVFSCPRWLRLNTIENKKDADMSDPTETTLSRLKALARRERRLLGGQVLVGVAAAGLVWWLLLVGAVNLEMVSARHAIFWQLGLVLLLLLPLRRLRWKIELVQQARVVERVAPELRGALITLLDHPKEKLLLRAVSPELVELLAQSSATALGKLSGSQVHPITGLVGSFRRFLLLGFGLLLTAGLPAGPLDALAALIAPQVVAEVEKTMPQLGNKALMGDITLRYLYPAYTRLEPMVIQNSNGEIHAPPGTQVEIRARSAERYDQAALELVIAGESKQLPVELSEGRNLLGMLEIGKNGGIWRVYFQSGAEAGLASPDYPIVIEPDLPPEVAIHSNGSRLSVAVDTALKLGWRARDDYGLDRVVVEISQKGKKTREVPLVKLLGHPQERAEEISLSPQQLGLQAGDTVKLKIGAWDNDAVSGSKAGWSAVIELEIIGPNGSAPELARWRERVLEALVVALSGFVLEPVPPTLAQAEVLSWAASARARYTELEALYLERPTTPDAKALRELFRARSDFIGFAESLSESPNTLTANSLLQQDQQTWSGFASTHTQVLEDTTLYFDAIIQATATRDLLALLKQLQQEATEVRAELQNPNFKAAALQQRLAQLETLLDQVETQAASLKDDQTREFVQPRLDQIQATLQQARARTSTDMPAAREAVGEAARQIDELIEGLMELQQRGQSRDDQLASAMKQLGEELAQLEQDQRKLREQLAQSRERFGPDMEEAVEAWEKLEQQATRLSENTQAVAERNVQSSTASALDAAQSDAEGVLDSIRARDLEVARDRADDLRRSLEGAQRRLQFDTRLGRDTRAQQQEISQLQRQVEALEQALEQLAEQRHESSPELAQELKNRAAEQQQLAERAREAQQHAEEVSQQLPMRAPGLQEGTEGAARQSQRAEGAMQEGDATQAEGGQQATEDGLREAQEALKRAQQRMRQMQQASSGKGGQEQRPEGEGDEEGEKRGQGGEPGEGDNEDAQLELPSPEQFQTPEEYRKALMEGMSGEVPEEYEALMRRYYEELVRQ
jgi:hypothetical protein